MTKDVKGLFLYIVITSSFFVIKTFIYIHSQFLYFRHLEWLFLSFAFFKDLNLFTFGFDRVGQLPTTYLSIMWEYILVHVNSKDKSQSWSIKYFVKALEYYYVTSLPLTMETVKSLIWTGETERFSGIDLSIISTQ